VLLLSTLLLACAGQQPSPSGGDVAGTSSTPLHDAAIGGDLIKLKELLDSGKYDVNALDGAGRTPLAAAMATCSTFGQNTTDSSSKTTPSGGAFFQCLPGLDDGVAALLTCAGADVNVDVFPKDKPGYKLIHIAACYADTTLNFLLPGGADPNELYTLPNSNTTVSPLTWSIMCGHETSNITQLPPGSNEWGIMRLIKGGANPLLFGTDKPASALVRMPQEFRKCDKLSACTADDVRRGVRNLLLAGSETVKAGWEPAIYEQVWTAQEGYYIAQSGEWKRKDGNETAPPPAGYPITKEDICATADSYYRGEVKRGEEDVLLASYQKTYPLHVAVATNDLATVQQLLASGGHGVNEKDDMGFTPLQVGLSCYPHNSQGCGPGMDAATAAFLISKGAQARVLEPMYPDLNTTTNFTVLHTAAFRGHRDLVEVLLKGGASADINLAYYDDAQQTRLTPLMDAVVGCYNAYDSPFGNISTNGTIKLLLDSGADPLPFGPGDTPLSHMIKIPIVQLRKCGENVGTCNAEEVKRLVQEWESLKGLDLNRSCPDAWFRVWEAQEKAAAKGGAGGGNRAPAQSGRKLFGPGKLLMK